MKTFALRSHLGLLLAAIIAVSGCGASLRTLDRLAAAGSIHEGASVTARLRIKIAAPPARVWALLIDAPQWPRWAPQIKSVTAPGPLAAGTSFQWQTGGSSIHSQVQLFEPDRRLGWTGTVFTAKAIHLWQLIPEGDGSTTVSVAESLDGPLMKILYPPAQLAQADSEWLGALKRAAEQRP